MTQLRFIPVTFAASAALLFTSIAGAVAAPPTDPSSTCSVNQDCGRGYECTVVGESGCTSAACAPGQSCPAPEPCVVTETKGCTPAHCKATADCADGMVCHEWTEPCAVSNCACAPGQKDCNCGTTTCDPTTISMCTPRYLLPCTAAADCGDGFTCEQQSCNCAGSGGGATPPSAGAPDLPAGGAGPDEPADPLPTPVPTPACSCTASGQFQCVAKNITCAAVSDCPAGWSCELEVQPALPTPACTGKDCPAPLPAPTTTSSCRPPYSSGGGSTGSTGTGTATSGGGVVFPGVPTPTSGGTDKGTSGSAGSASTPESMATDDGSHESAACQYGRAPLSSGAFSLLALLGAMFGLKRRRAQG